jgi:hypothetical protein
MLRGEQSSPAPHAKVLRMKGVRTGTPFVLLGLALALMLVMSRSYLIQSDEGHILSGAWQMWNGKKMYDEFQHYFGPGSSYAVYITWALTGGPSFLSARVLSLLLSFSSVIALYLILSRRGVRGLGLAVALAAWIFAAAQYPPINHNSFSSFAAAWLLFLLLRAQDRDAQGAGRFVDHFLVGIGAGVVMLFLHTKGLFLLGALSAFTMIAVGGWRGVRAAAAIAAGGLCIVLPILLVWRPSVLIREWFLVPMAGDYLGHTGASRPLAIACLVVTAAITAIALRLRDRQLIAIAIFQAALIGSVLYNVDVPHVGINAFPLVVFVPLALQRYAASKRSAGAPPPAEKFSATATMAIVVAMVGVLIATPVGRASFKGSTLYVDFIRRVPRNIFPQPKVVAAHAVYVGPFMPGLYFLLGKKNPFFVSETIVCGPDCLRRLRGEIEQVKPEIAFLNYEMARHMRYDANNPVDTYFRDRYVRCPDNADFEGLIIRAIDPSWCP